MTRRLSWCEKRGLAHSHSLARTTVSTLSSSSWSNGSTSSSSSVGKKGTVQARRASKQAISPRLIGHVSQSGGGARTWIRQSFRDEKNLICKYFFSGLLLSCLILCLNMYAWLANLLHLAPPAARPRTKSCRFTSLIMHSPAVMSRRKMEFGRRRCYADGG